MGELRLYAIGVDEVREMMGAGAELTAELRPVADRAFAPTDAKSPSGLLGRLGPLFRRPAGAPVLGPEHPRPEDFERLASGAWVPPDRLEATWRLLEALVAGRAWGRLRVHLAESELNALDFDLARAGAPSALGIGAFLASDARIGLRNAPGWRICYRPFRQSLATAEAIDAALPELPDPAHADRLRPLSDWLAGFTAWAETAHRLDRPAPDLIGFAAAEPTPA